MRFEHSPHRFASSSSGTNSPLFGRLFYLAMVKIIDDYGRRVKRTAHGVVVGYIVQSDLLCIFAHFSVQPLPITVVAARIYVAVERCKFGVFILYVFHNLRLKRTAQIQIFQPYKVATIFRPLDYSLHVGDFGEYRRNKTGRPHARIVKNFHGGEPTLDRNGVVHILAETLVQRIYRPRNAGVRKALYQIHVAQNQVRFCGYGELRPTALQLFEDGACAPILFLARLIRVRYRTYKYLFIRISFGVCDRLPIFHVDKLSPRLFMSRKPLHKAGIAILATVFAADIRVERIAAHRQV